MGVGMKSTSDECFTRMINEGGMSYEGLGIMMLFGYIGKHNCNV